MEKRKPGRPRKPTRPDIYKYHSYRAFLKDWFEYRRLTAGEFSLRGLAQRSGVGTGYLPMILAGTRKFSWGALEKLAPHLELKPAERKHLENLVRLESDSPAARMTALAEISERSSYRKRNPFEAEFFRYMGHWFFIAIREMAALPEFRPDPAWIQSRLTLRVPLGEIKSALEFLIRHGYLEIRDDGAAVTPKEALNCKGEIYENALIEYHRQMLQAAGDTVTETHYQERHLQGFTLPTNPARYEAALEILKRAMSEIEALEKREDGPKEAVHHVEIALFPLVRGVKK